MKKVERGKPREGERREGADFILLEEEEEEERERKRERPKDRKDRRRSMVDDVGWSVVAVLRQGGVCVDGVLVVRGNLEMGLGPEAIQVEGWDTEKKSDRETTAAAATAKDGEDDDDNDDNEESKSTNDTSRDQPVAPVGSSTTTTSNGEESNPSSPKAGEEELKIASQLRKFTFNELKAATRNFRPESLLGEGGFGCVFKGWIEENGTAAVKPGTGLTVAVKTLNHDGLQGHKEWLKISSGALPLPWSIRMKIALGAAKGLAFLHEEAERPVIYRDFKTSNILLDADYNAKLSDFGLAKDGPEGDKTHVSTRVMGTYGYAAPEYVMTEPIINETKWEHNLVEWARPHLGERRRLFRLIDPRLDGNFSVKGAQKAAQLAHHCLSRDPKARPLMSEVVEVLKPLLNLKDMASASYYFQTMQAERTGAVARNGMRSPAGFVSRNGQPVRNLSIPNGSQASPYHQHLVHLHQSPKLSPKANEKVKHT
ncbi:hypothetical protein Syun_023768 [Stephania yunnanensis]|uniref:Protein kinase domain-containing protein n=1 Tax=Stephania yunnanensis TaxID=152371 RepID=A0AAP0I2G8_9MAGN